MQEKKSSKDCCDSTMAEFLPHVAERFCPGKQSREIRLAGQESSALQPAGDGGGPSIRNRSTGNRRI